MHSYSLKVIEYDSELRRKGRQRIVILHNGDLEIGGVSVALNHAEIVRGSRNTVFISFAGSSWWFRVPGLVSAEPEPEMTEVLYWALLAAKRGQSDQAWRIAQRMSKVRWLHFVSFTAVVSFCIVFGIASVAFPKGIWVFAMLAVVIVASLLLSLRSARLRLRSFAKISNVEGADCDSDNP